MKQQTHDAILPAGYDGVARQAAATLASLKANPDLRHRRGGSIAHRECAESEHLAARMQLRALVDIAGVDLRAQGITLWDALIALRQPLMDCRGEIAPNAIRAVLADISTWVLEGYVGGRQIK